MATDLCYSQELLHPQYTIAPIRMLLGNLDMEWGMVETADLGTDWIPRYHYWMRQGNHSVQASVDHCPIPPL